MCIRDRIHGVLEDDPACWREVEEWLEAARTVHVPVSYTHLLRDVKEDADRGRIYLAADQLRKQHVAPERILALAAGAEMVPNELALLRDFGIHAQTLYRSGYELIPMPVSYTHLFSSSTKWRASTTRVCISAGSTCSSSRR